VFRKGTSRENLNVGNETLKSENGILDISQFQRHAILPVLWIVLLAPLYEGLYLQSASFLTASLKLFILLFLSGQETYERIFLMLVTVLSLDIQSARSVFPRVLKKDFT
jgi:hypothetical protein